MYVGIGDAARFLGVAVVTLRRWESSGTLKPSYRTSGGHRRYAVTTLEDFAGEDTHKAADERKTIVYARVSSHDQKDDLGRQAAHLRAHCTNSGWGNVEEIRDIGSELNAHKRGLRRLITMLLSRRVARLVLTHTDRLLRFGNEVIFTMCRAMGVEVVVTEDTEKTDAQSRLADDVLAVMTVFSARLHGQRSQAKKTISA